MFPTVNDLWVSKLKKADVLCDSSWILNDSTGVVEVINKLNLSRSEIDKASPLLLQSFDFFNSAVYLANFYLFTFEFDFIKCLLKSNTCPFVLHRLSLVHRFVDDLFVPDFPDFVNFMYLNQDSFGSCIYPKTSCKLNCMSKGFSYNFLDLAVRQSPQGLSRDIFDKCSQPEYAGIEMIRMPHVHSNISMTVKLGVVNSQFYRFLRLCSCKKFFVFQMVSLIVFLKAKGYPLKVLLKRTRGLLLKEKFLFGISTLGISRMILLQVL
jgi:hypothetical protein